MPSPMRVVAGVVITLALALGGIVALKKMLLKADGRWSSQGIRILGKAALGPSVRAHLLQVDTTRVLVIEGRSGIGVTLLPPAPEQSGKASLT